MPQLDWDFVKERTAMAYAQTPTMNPVINAPDEVRSAFIVRVYQHLALAVAAFVAIEAFLFMSGIAEAMFDFFIGAGGAAWLLLMGGVIAINWFASKLTHQIDNAGAQYGGLFLIAGAEALIFAPFLYLAFNSPQYGGGLVANAVVITLIGFAGLTAVAFVTRRDLSFLRPIVMWGFLAAIGLIVAGAIFGFELGIIFSVAMIALAGMSILYQTQSVIRTYPEWAHVGAAVALFSSLMTMFWYVLRLMMQLSRN